MEEGRRKTSYSKLFARSRPVIHDPERNVFIPMHAFVWERRVIVKAIAVRLFGELIWISMVFAACFVQANRTPRVSATWVRSAHGLVFRYSSKVFWRYSKKLTLVLSSSPLVVVVVRASYQGHFWTHN